MCFHVSVIVGMSRPPSPLTSAPVPPTPFTFLAGRPPEACRPYTTAELDALQLATLAGAQSSGPQPPVAVFVSGLPGSGKSSLAAGLHKSGLAPLELSGSCAIVDDDVLRGFHAQYASLASAPDGVRYTDLSPWFDDGSGYEEFLFRAAGGLLDVTLRSRCSFVQAVNVHSAGSVAWVSYVVRRGYRAHLVLVHVPVKVAVERAAARAAATGRWCSSAYIESCAVGLRRHIADVWRACRASGGTAVCVDNSADAPLLRAPPMDALATQAPRVCARLAHEYGLLDELLAPERVAGFAREQVARLPRGVLAGVDCCLAGGAFKALLSADAVPPPPRDLDLWTPTAGDEATLVANLRAVPGAVYSEGAFQHVIRLPAGADGHCSGGDERGCDGGGKRNVIIVEIKRGHRGNLGATLASFDIALAAIGARLVNGEVVETAVHALAAASVAQRAPLLVPGLPNPAFLLATAERVLRYADELGWPRPVAQLRELAAVFSAAASARRAVLVANYRAASVAPALRAEVMAACGVAAADMAPAGDDWGIFVGAAADTTRESAT